LVVALVLVLGGGWAFDPMQGYAGRFNLFIDGNSWAVTVLVAGIGLLALMLTVTYRIWGKVLSVTLLALCLAATVALATRIPKDEAVEKAYGYFSGVEDPALVGVWFGVERPRGAFRGFETFGRELGTRVVWKVVVDHDALFGCVWIDPWSGEILAVDDPWRPME